MTKKAKIIELRSKGDQPVETEPGAIAVGEEIQPADVIRLAHRSKFSHVVQKNGHAFDLELTVAKTMSENLDAFINDPMGTIFGAPKEGHIRASLNLNNRTDEHKSKTLGEFESFLTGIKGARRIRDQAMLVADELYTNAMKLGHAHYLISPDAVTRAGTVQFFASVDGDRLVLGCRDSFGELSFSHILGRLTQCFENGIAQSIKQGNSGAGIGSFLVFNTCVSYYCGVKKGQATVVCVAIPLGVSDDELATLPKNIHLVSA